MINAKVLNYNDAVATFIVWTVRTLVIGFLCYGALEIVGVIIIIIIIINEVLIDSCRVIMQGVGRFSPCIIGHCMGFSTSWWLLYSTIL